MADYERLRERHLAEFSALVPEHLERLRWPVERVREERERRLRALLVAARERSPWHGRRLAAIDPATATEADLTRIPPMTKDDMMADLDGIFADPRLSRRLVEAHVDTLVDDAYLIRCRRARMPAPDLTAVGAAFGRAAHVLLDDPPYVFDDTLSIRLPDDDVLRAVNLLGPDGRLVVTREDPRAQWRGTFVGRARFVEDFVAQRLAKGVDQYVILGAGLDTFAQRRPEAAARLRIFEVDEQGTQRWKEARLRDLQLPIPPQLRFVPVDFESGDSWVDLIAKAGFDVTRASVVASTGVTQYISRDALVATMRAAAELAPGTTFICTFILPVALIDPGERDLRAATEERSAGRGCPWISFYAPDEMLRLARAAGFDDVCHVSASEFNARYFAARPDGLRAASGEHLVTATRTDRVVGTKS